jgi:hypothetical protein
MPSKKGTNTKGSTAATGETDVDTKHSHHVSLSSNIFYNEISYLERT